MSNKCMCRVIGICLLTILTCSLQAQIFFVDEEKFQLRVSHMDEFIHRMNLETDCFGEPVTSESDSLTLKKTLATLFSIDSVGRSYSDSIAVMLMDSFLTRNYSFKWTDTTVYALATCKAKYKRKELELTLQLRMDTLKNGNRKWFIADALWSLEDFMQKDSAIFLSPAMHGTNFLSLPGILDLNSSLLPSYTADSFHMDNLSFLLAWLYDGSLTIQGFKSIEYVFSHIPGFTFVVGRNDNLRANTSGWQIMKIDWTHQP